MIAKKIKNGEQFVRFACRSIVNNVMRGVGVERYELNGVNGNQSSSAAAVGSNNGGGGGGSSRPNMRHAVELKSSQPIFPGQPPPSSARTEKNFVAAQPPPRQSSQVRVRFRIHSEKQDVTAIN